MAFMKFYTGSEANAKSHLDGIYLATDTKKIFYNGDSYSSGSGGDIDLSNYATKDDLKGYLPLTGGTVSGANGITVNNGDTSKYINIKADGITINGKSKTDILNAAGGTTSLAEIQSQVMAGIVDGAPETLDTLKELASALGNDPNFATTIANQIGSKIETVNASGTSPLTLNASKSGSVVNITGNVANASQSSSGLMSASDKTKLDTAKLINKATVLFSNDSVDLNDYGIDHIGYYCAVGGNSVLNKPEGVDHFGLVVLRVASGLPGQILVGKTDQNLIHTYIRYKLYNSEDWSDWINLVDNNNIQDYLPIASTTQLGCVRVGDGLEITPEGILNCTIDPGSGTVSWGNISGKPTFATVATTGSYNDLTDKPSIPSAYTLPAATASKLGGVKIGSGLAVTADGTISCTITPGLTEVTWSQVKDKPNFATVATSGSYNDLTNKPSLATVATSGSYNDLTNKPSIPSAYVLPKASATTLGGIKVGDGLEITSDGTLNCIIDPGSGTVSWGNIQGKPSFATVATTGSYNDLTDKPNIPTNPVTSTQNGLAIAADKKAWDSFISFMDNSGLDQPIIPLAINTGYSYDTWDGSDGGTLSCDRGEGVYYNPSTGLFESNGSDKSVFPDIPAVTSTKGGVMIPEDKKVIDSWKNIADGSVIIPLEESFRGLGDYSWEDTDSQMIIQNNFSECITWDSNTKEFKKVDNGLFTFPCIPVATQTTGGVMSPEDKKKLDGLGDSPELSLLYYANNKYNPITNLDMMVGYGGTPSISLSKSPTKEDTINFVGNNGIQVGAYTGSQTSNFGSIDGKHIVISLDLQTQMKLNAIDTENLLTSDDKEKLDSLEGSKLSMLRYAGGTYNKVTDITSSVGMSGVVSISLSETPTEENTINFIGSNGITVSPFTGHIQGNNQDITKGRHVVVQLDNATTQKLLAIDTDNLLTSDDKAKVDSISYIAENNLYISTVGTYKVEFKQNSSDSIQADIVYDSQGFRIEGPQNDTWYIARRGGRKQVAFGTSGIGISSNAIGITPPTSYTLQVNGTIACTEVVQTSDINLKENIKEITAEDLEKVSNIQIKSFNYKDDDKSKIRYGIIAQEVESAGLDSLVSEDTLNDKGIVKSVNYIDFLNLKVKMLEEKVKDLSTKLDNITSQLAELLSK